MLTPFKTSLATLSTCKPQSNHTDARYSAQIFRSKYAPRYAVPYAVCIAFFAASIGSVLSMWYFCSDVEKQTRMINRERRAAGKEGVMIEADVEVSKG